MADPQCLFLKHKLIRDLWWVMASPGMLRSSPATESVAPLGDAVGASLVDASRGWLAGLDADASPLEAFLDCPSRKSTRLGFYAQSLVEYWIDACPALGATASRCGQQVLKHGSVVGSLKYVFCCRPTDARVRAALGADPTGEPAPGRPLLCHWEFSIKFFVHVPGGDADDLARFVGPFLHENLEARVATGARKVALSGEPDVRKWASRELAKVACPDRVLAIRAASVLRGFLFYEAGASGASPSVSPAHGRGWAARSVDAMRNAAPSTTTHWIVLSKPHWLGPCRVPRDDDGGWALPASARVGAPLATTAVSDAEIADELDALAARCPATPVMVASLERFDDGALYETSRGFLLPPEWDPAPLLAGATFWKKSTRKAPRRRDDGTYVEVGTFPSPAHSFADGGAHPSVAGLRSRGVFSSPSGGQPPGSSNGAVVIGAVTVDAGDPAVETGDGLLDALEGKRDAHAKSGRKHSGDLLKYRAGKLLAESPADAAALSIDALRALGARATTMPRAFLLRVGGAIVDAAPADANAAGAADALLKASLALPPHDAVAFNPKRLELSLAVACAQKFGAPSLEDDSFVRRTLADALEAYDGRSKADGALHRLELAALLVALVGRPPRLPSSVVATAAVALARGDSLKTASELCKARPAGFDGDDADVFVDVDAARALVDAARSLGHRKVCRRLARDLLGEEGDSPPPADDLSASDVAYARGAARSKSGADGFLALPPGVAVTLVEDAAGARAAAATLASERVLGVDVEWRPGAAGASLAQVAARFACFLLDLERDPCDAVFDALRGKTLLFFGASADVEKVRTVVPGAFSCSKIVDLRTSSRGLGDVAKQTLGGGLDKGPQRSDWAARPLPAALRSYAALDAHVLLQLAAAAPFPASLTPGDAVAALGGAGRLVDGAGDAVLCKTLALVDAFGARALVVLDAGKSLAPGRLPGFRLAPPAELRPLFGFDKGTLGPAGGHGGATVLVDRPLAGRDVSLGCGDAATALVAGADALVARLARDGAAAAKFADLTS